MWEPSIEQLSQYVIKSPPLPLHAEVDKPLSVYQHCVLQIQGRKSIKMQLVCLQAQGLLLMKQ